MRRRIWIEFELIAKFFTNILMNGESLKPPYNSIFGFKLKKMVNFRSFDNMVAFTIKNNIQIKIKIEITICMLVGTNRII
jgi:hypothetical protein